MYEIFFVNFWVTIFVSGLRTLKPEKKLKNLKIRLNNLKPKNFFLKYLGPR